MQRPLLYRQLLTLAVLVFWDVYLGIDQGLYLVISWWDIPAHILGGLWVGFFGAWFAFLFGMRISIVRIMLFAFAVGAAWEVFEVITHTGGSPFMTYWLDTSKDLLDDVIGATLAGITVSRMRR